MPRTVLRSLSISTRLALWYGLSFLLLLSVFVVFLYTSFHLSLHHDFSEQLRSETDRVRALLTVVDGRPHANTSGALSSGAYAVEGISGTYVRVLSPQGAVVDRSQNFPTGSSFAPELPTDTTRTEIARSWQGVPARSAYARITGSGGESVGWVEVTRLESAVHRELHRLRWLLAVGVLLGAAVAMAAGHRLARRALGPVTQMTAAARRIEGEDLKQRLPTERDAQDELTELAMTLNGLLQRLDDSFARERRFRADAAHEMFTPISAIQSETDVALRVRRSVPEYEEALKAVRGHAGRLSRIVEDLLELSRAESLRADDVPLIDISDVAKEAAETFTARAQQAGIHLALDGGKAVHARVRRRDLETVVSNLVDNAVKYTPEGGQVRIVTETRNGHAELRIEDTGIGISEEQYGQLFDRFYRADGDGTTRGTGLGLSIVRAIAEAYGGSLHAASDGTGSGSVFSVRFPA